jgi:phosphatidylethanolamine-binding protein (PEBP) family uncharacterized protein
VRRTFVLAVAALALLGAGGCNDQDGRELPPPDATTTTTVPAGEEASDGGFRLESPAFTAGGELPARFTCFGDGISPPLAWAGAPPAHSLAIVVFDADAGGFVHWIVTGLDPVVQGFGEGGLPEGAVVGPNDADGGWAPPCPSEGTHRYRFVLLALAEPVEVDPDIDAGDLAALLRASSTDRAGLTSRVAAP